jgi:DNA primase
MDYLTLSTDFLVEEQIFIMKQNQVIKWVFLQELLNQWYILILENIKINIKKDFHQKKKQEKDGKNMKNNKKKKP